MKEYELNNTKMMGGGKAPVTNKVIVAAAFVLQGYNWKKKDGPGPL
ncbi:hypothetical protein HLH09_04155 [Lactobacillus crispatus]|nr:hypothetical protein [Lactobacillus crispatus]MBG0720231.1 hypothetical protein [Lactobacillus crispatus]MDX5120150.1 hypothetical protein [Lactobacillus crispatus]MDX5125948.1 hypothetical protein [Lactobacillus crispatus]